MTGHGDTIREHVGHIARGCRSGGSHNPSVHEQAIDAALDALEQERDEAVHALTHRADGRFPFLQADFHEATDRAAAAEARAEAAEQALAVERDALAAAAGDLVSALEQVASLTIACNVAVTQKMRAERVAATLAEALAAWVQARDELHAWRESQPQAEQPRLRAVEDQTRELELLMVESEARELLPAALAAYKALEAGGDWPPGTFMGGGMAAREAENT